jgi:hypothetical protein
MKGCLLLANMPSFTVAVEYYRIKQGGWLQHG